MIKVAHIAFTPLAGSPIRIVDALNNSKDDDIEARLIVLNEHAYGNRKFKNDLLWSKNEESCREVIRSSDIIHLHHYFDLDSDIPFGQNFIKMCAPNAKFLRQYHTHPLTISRNDKSLAYEIIYSDIPSVVVAQFQERYYPNSLVVANIVPMKNESYFPSEHRIGKRIGFSPSVSNSAWSEYNGFSKWDTKGAPETLSLLEEMKKSISNVEIDYIFDTPHEEHLRRKNNCGIFIDELITGSYHISSLESLTMGIPTLAYLDPRTIHIVQEITGSLEHPWINCRLEEAVEYLSEVLRDEVLRSDLGQRSRAWMQNYWNENLMVRKYIDAYQSLLDTGRVLQSPRFDSENRTILWLYQTQYDISFSARRNIALHTPDRIEEGSERWTSADHEKVDYAGIHDGYWRRLGGSGTHEFHDPTMIAKEILRVSGPCRTLDVGCGTGGLVLALLRRGFDAAGVDISSVAVDHAVKAAPGRYLVAAASALPFPADAFPMVTSINFIEHLHERDIGEVIGEMWRICSDTLYLRIATAPDRDGTRHFTGKPREWWEERLITSGFRKHLARLDVIRYQEIDSEAHEIVLVMQKIPREIRDRHPLDDLLAERDLHMDMTREVGRRSDAHVVRYRLAQQFIRPGDTVLDLACGLGYGTALLAHGSGAVRVTGIDDSAYAIAYAKDNFGPAGPRLEFHRGNASEMQWLEDESIDYAVSMETLEHLPDPEGFLAQIHRVLKPSGRIIVSVPNMWVDETGSDPNPHHLHVYNLPKLIMQISVHFMVESIWSQTAGGGFKLPDAERTLREVDRESGAIPDSEWWLCLAMKSPLAASNMIGYQETVNQSAACAESHVVDFATWYDNPYLYHGLVNRGFRPKDPALLSRLSHDVIAASRIDSADRGAALCVLAYQLLGEFSTRPSATGIQPDELRDLNRWIDDYVAHDSKNPHVARWKISLTYVQGLLLRMQGDLAGAKTAFSHCTTADPLVFSPLIATKTLAAGLALAQIELAQEEREAARRTLGRALRTATAVVGRDWPNVIGNVETPFIFGFLELKDVCDLGAKCALIMEGLSRGWTSAYTQSRSLTGDMNHAVAVLNETVAVLNETVAERDGQVAVLNETVAERDGQVAVLNETVAERDGQVAVLNETVAERDGQVAVLNETVAERDGQVAVLNETVAERDGQVAVLNETVAERDGQVAVLNETVAERDGQVAVLNETVAERDGQVATLHGKVEEIWASSSWRLTRPLRGIKLVLTGRARLAHRLGWHSPTGMMYLLRRFLFHAGLPVAGRFRSRRRVARASEVAAPAAAIPREPSPEGDQRCPRIAMLVQDFRDGGLEKVVIDLTKQFLKSGIVCPILVAGSAGRAAKQAEELGCSVQAFGGDVGELVSVVRENGIEVVITHHCYEPLEQLSMANVKLIEVIHNAYYWQRDLPSLSGLRDRCVDRFVAVSDFVRDYTLTALSIPADRIRVIENGLSRYGLIRPDLQQLCRRRATTVNRPVLVHLANAHPQKNHVAVLRAFERVLADHPGASLVLAGVLDDTTDTGRRVQAEIESRRLHDRVRRVGPLGRRELSRLLADAHIGLLPSAVEGFSIASLEYAYFGLPTVLSDTGAARHLTERYGHAVIADTAALSAEQLEPAGIERRSFEPDSSTVSGIATAARTILESYAKFSDMARQAGGDWESYSIGVVAREYRNLLTEGVT